MDKVRKPLALLLVALGILGLCVGFAMQFHFKPTAEELAEIRLGIKVFWLSLLALIAGTLLSKNKHRKKIVLAILLLVALGFVFSFLAERHAQEKRTLTNTSGTYSKELLSQNQHSFSIIPPDSAEYSLSSRKYQNAYHKILESSYVIISSANTIDVIEYATDHSAVLECTSSGTYPCIPRHTSKGLVGCYLAYPGLTCQYYPDRDHLISVKSFNATYDEITAVINDLAAVNSRDIVLTQ